MARTLPVTVFLMISLTGPDTARTATLPVPGTYPTIAAGLAAAVHGDTVVVACGTYVEHDLTMTSGVVLRSEQGDPDCVTIDAAGAIRCLRAAGVNATTTIEGIEFTGGVGSGGGVSLGPLARGTLLRCRFRDNRTSGDGAGLVVTTGSSVLVRECEFVDNSAREGAESDLQRGGGAWSCQSSVRFEDCLFDTNHARIGGAVFALQSEVELVQCVLRENDARLGGAVYGSGSGLRCEGCRFEANGTDALVAQVGRGGAMFAVDGDTEYRDCVFRGNFAGHSGGAVYHTGSGSVLGRSSTFRDNRAYVNGGAGVLAVGSDLRGCVIAGNDAVVNNGGGFVLSEPTTIAQCTFWANRAGMHGSALVWTSPVLTLTRTILAGGRGGASVYCFEDDDAVVSCTDIFDNEGGDWVACIAEHAGGNGNLSVDARFCDAEGGDLHLQWGSPCLPAGSPDCGLIGALGFGGCGTVSVEPQSWARVKAWYRGDPDSSGR